MTQAPILPAGTLIDGWTLGLVARTRVGAVTYEGQGADQSRVEVTVYAPQCFPSALVRERSLRELRQLANVQAATMVRVISAGKTEEGGIYEVTEVIEGQSIETLAPLPRPRVGQILAQVGEALLAGQNTGVIHRNLGVHAVFEGPRGIKVGGYAVGEPLGQGAFGPLDTISPEQATGKVVDQRSLVYNLAALAHFLLTGQPLFTGTAAEKLDAHANKMPVGDIDPLLAKALAKDARMRPMMLKQYVAELAAWAPSAPVTAAPSASGEAQPTTRGWTQFMEAEEPAAAGNEPAAPASPEAGRPTTRGWTMFMEASDAEPEQGSGGGGAPAAAQPAAAPTTRGWTMFMEAGEDGSKASAPAGAPNAAAPAPVAAAASPVVPAAFDLPNLDTFGAPNIGAPNISTTIATPNVSVPTPSVAAPPPAAAVPAASAPTLASNQPPSAGAPVVGSGAAKPTTRGWTLFMESAPAASPAATPTPAPSAPTAAPAPSPAASPANPVSVTPAARAPINPAAPQPARPLFAAPTPSRPQSPLAPPLGSTATTNPQSATATPAATPPNIGGGPGARPQPATRGWTLFMDAPLPKGPAPAKPTASPSPSEPAAGRPASAAPATGSTPSFSPANPSAPGPLHSTSAAPTNLPAAAPAAATHPLPTSTPSPVATPAATLPIPPPSATVLPHEVPAVVSPQVPAASGGGAASPSVRDHNYNPEPAPVGVRATTLSLETTTGWTTGKVAAAVVLGGILLGGVAAGVYYLLP